MNWTCADRITRGCFPAIEGLKTGMVRLVLDPDSMTKTILPNVSVDSYLILFENGQVAQASMKNTEVEPVIELAVGVWDITID